MQNEMCYTKQFFFVKQRQEHHSSKSSIGAYRDIGIFLKIVVIRNFFPNISPLILMISSLINFSDFLFCPVQTVVLRQNVARRNRSGVGSELMKKLRKLRNYFPLP